MQAVTRIYVNKATLVAMNAQLTEQLGMVKVAGTLQQSTQVTTLVNNLMRAPELQQTVVQMQKEMMKARCQCPCRILTDTAVPCLHAGRSGMSAERTGTSLLKQTPCKSTFLLQGSEVLSPQRRRAS